MNHLTDPAWRKNMKKRYWRSRTFAFNEPKVKVRTKRTKSDIESVKIHVYRENSQTSSPVPKSSSLKLNTWNIVQSRSGVRSSHIDSPVVKQWTKREEDGRSVFTNLVPESERQSDCKVTRIPDMVKLIRWSSLTFQIVRKLCFIFLWIIYASAIT